MKLAFNVVAALAAVASAVVAVQACSDAVVLNQETMYITVVNTRISTCTALSEFHKGLASAPVEMTDQNKPVSSPNERSNAEATIARALNLCLVEFSNVPELRICVEKRVNGIGAHKVHDKLETNPTKGLPEGADILAC